MIFKRKITSVKIAKIYSQITIAAWMQPLQYDLRSSAEKDNSITHAAAAASNLEHTRFRAPAFLPTTQSMQHSCSHSNAICTYRFKKRIELRTQTQPLVAKHRGGTNRVRNDRSRNRRTHEVPFTAACSHFTRKNTRFRAPASSPTQAPCNIHAGQFFVMYCYVVSSLIPPFIKVNSFVMYCYVV